MRDFPDLIVQSMRWRNGIFWARYGRKQYVCKYVLRRVRSRKSSSYVMNLSSLHYLFTAEKLYINIKYDCETDRCI